MMDFEQVGREMFQVMLKLREMNRYVDPGGYHPEKGWWREL
jgi:hypothetical protein